MSADHGHHDHHDAAYPAIVNGLENAALEALLVGKFAAVRDVRDRWDLTLIIPGAKLREVVQFLRDDATLKFDQLIDIAGIDFLSYPEHRGPRFAAVYLFKSTVFKHRVKLLVEVEEEATELASLHDLYRIANWAEREVYDQLGITFVGHPGLKRLLNHHEFVGHPLRKDYPCQKRQKLSMNDSLIDQMAARLTHLGYTVLETGEAHIPEALTVSPLASKGTAP